jgi:hypothetical protein
VLASVRGSAAWRPADHALILRPATSDASTRECQHAIGSSEPASSRTRVFDVEHLSNDSGSASANARSAAAPHFHQPRPQRRRAGAASARADRRRRTRASRSPPVALLDPRAYAFNETSRLPPRRAIAAVSTRQLLVGERDHVTQPASHAGLLTGRPDGRCGPRTRKVLRTPLRDVRVRIRGRLRERRGRLHR